MDTSLDREREVRFFLKERAGLTDNVYWRAEVCIEGVRYAEEANSVTWAAARLFDTVTRVREAKRGGS